MKQRSMIIAKRKLWIVALPALFVILILSFIQIALAGPVTNPTSPPSAPYVKLGIYQGVISIIADSTNAMEIGYQGTDIAATGKISLLPGGLTDPNGITIAKSNIPGSTVAAVYLNNGRICLNNDGAGSYQCVSSWASGGSGDVNWSRVGTVLSPAGPPNQIRIGTTTNPVAASLHGLDLYTASAAPALATTGQFLAGIGTAGNNVHVAGQVRLQYIKYPLGLWGDQKIEMMGSTFGPWSGLDMYYDETIYPCPPDCNPLIVRDLNDLPDADTFDSVADLPNAVTPFGSFFCQNKTNPFGFYCVNGLNPCTDIFGTQPDSTKCSGGDICQSRGCANANNTGPDATKCLNNGDTCQKNNLYISDVASTTPGVTYTRLCLRTNSTKLCAGGNSNSNAGQPCPIGNECINGATCTNICGTSPKICPKDSDATLKCCNDSNDCHPPDALGNCGALEVGVRGRVFTYLFPNNVNNATTDQRCQDFANSDHKCTGTVAIGCNVLEQQYVRSTKGVSVGWTPQGGPGPCYNFDGTNWTCSCDLYLENDTPYADLVTGQGGSLCTNLLTSS